ncbi:restriction endonuclease subunit S [Methylomonas methanica]|uniref:Type I restriction modification DNA specificity domain-containing protein n=1 Tax=Methylomonas methanica TaxID=421 RepID=A0A177MY39_METMH|nr:restriction endonuclease subunit S [Methylomonas methanica]OAI10562.1 hypothetical protein A1332_23795 [Methylomonas methanica]
MKAKVSNLTSLLLTIVDNRGKTVPISESGFPLIATNCIKHSSIYPTSENVRYVDDKTKKNWFRAHPKPNDIIFVNRGTPGRVCLVPDPVPFCVAQDMMGFRCDPEKIDFQYLFAVLRSDYIQKKIENFHVGLVIPHFKKGDLDNITIPRLASREEELAVGEIYLTLSKKIELNNCLNAQLEAMAKTLYDYWFVQFDFPFDFAQGKPAATGKPYKSSGGKMVYNPELKREIPEGWSVKNLNNCVDTILDHRGKTPKKLAGEWCNDSDGIIAISAKNIKNGKLVNLDSANKVNNELFNKWMPDKLIEGDILMTSEAPAGEFYFILGETKYCMSQRVFAIRANLSVIFPSVLYFELSKGNGLSQILSSLSGSTVFGIRQDVLREIKVLVPEIYLQELFNNILLPQLRKIEVIDQETKCLAEIRDWLLPMLMNGQVTVK